MSGMEPAQPVFIDPKADPLPDGAVRYGRQEGAAELKVLGVCPACIVRQCVEPSREEDGPL